MTIGALIDSIVAAIIYGPGASYESVRKQSPQGKAQFARKAVWRRVIFCGPVAQWKERLFCERGDVGPNPARATNQIQ